MPHGRIRTDMERLKPKNDSFDDDWLQSTLGEMESEIQALLEPIRRQDSEIQSILDAMESEIQALLDVIESE